MRSAPLLSAIALAACILSGPMTSRAADLQPSRSGAVEMHWIVQRANASARQLKMSIPRDYVQNIHRDPRGASEMASGVTNNGISTDRDLVPGFLVGGGEFSALQARVLAEHEKAGRGAVVVVRRRVRGILRFARTLGRFGTNVEKSPHAVPLEAE